MAQIAGGLTLEDTEKLSGLGILCIEDPDKEGSYILLDKDEYMEYKSSGRLEFRSNSLSDVTDNDSDSVSSEESNYSSVAKVNKHLHFESNLLEMIFEQINELRDELKEHKTEIQDLKTDNIALRQNAAETFERMQKLAGENEALKRGLDQATNTINAVVEDSTKTNDSISTLKLENTFIRKSLLEHQCKEMENDLLIFGVEESDEETIDEVASSFLRSKLDLYGTKAKRIHRIGKKRENNKQARPILVRLSNHRDKESILKSAKKLRNTKYAINERFPKSVEDHRKQLYPILRNAKREGKKAFIKIDTLFIDGEMYRGVGPGPLGYWMR